MRPNENRPTDDFIIRRVHTDEAMVKKLAILSKRSEEEIRLILRYNVVTVNQLSVLVGMDVFNLGNYLKKSTYKNGIYLNYVRLFSGEGIKGFRAVIRDEKFDKFIDKQTEYITIKQKAYDKRRINPKTKQPVWL